MLISTEVVYIDEAYSSEYPQYTAVPTQKLRDIEEESEPWRRFQKTELCDKGIPHIVIFRA